MTNVKSFSLEDTLAAETPTEVPDPFDPANLRLSQDYVERAGVKKLLTTVPVRKPNKQEWIRVRPESEYQDVFGLVELDREFYLVMPALASELTGEFTMNKVYTVITRQGVVFLWPVRLPGPDGKNMEWWRTAHEAASHATKEWVRVSANQNLGGYEIRIAAGQMSAPEWPEYAFRDLLRVAFQNRVIDRPDHEVIRQLRGLT
jgi:hypothetical protein